MKIIEEKAGGAAWSAWMEATIKTDGCNACRALGEADGVATAGRERCGASGRREGALHDGARAYLDTFALGVSSLEGVDGKCREAGWHQNSERSGMKVGVGDMFCATLAKDGVDNQSSPDCDSQRDSAIPLVDFTNQQRDGVRATLPRRAGKTPRKGNSIKER